MELLSKRGVFFALLAAQLIVLSVFLSQNGLISWSSLSTTHVCHLESTSPSLTPDFSSQTMTQEGVNIHLRSRTMERDTPSTTNDNNSSVVSNTRAKKNLLRDSTDSSNGKDITHIDKRKTTNQATFDQSGTFQSIDNKQAWIYSAYFDHVAAENGTPLVRSFAVVKRELIETIYCRFIFDNTTTTSRGTITYFPESHNRSYLPSYVDCPLSSNALPKYVSISYTEKQVPTNRLKILYPGPSIRNFTVCYSVLYNNKDITTQLIQSIEMNRLLGAEHFMAYVHDVSPDVDQILQRYQEDGLVTILQWPLPTKGSWYFAQMTAINDCVYRNRNISKFVVVVDTDELIIPRNNNNWMELINNASYQDKYISPFRTFSDHSTKGLKPLTCYIFKSSFFYSYTSQGLKFLTSEFNFTEKEKDDIAKYNILGLSQLWRFKKVFQHLVRSKYIVRPEKVNIAGIHYVYSLVDLDSCLKVTENMALVHHYRKHNLGTGDILDTSILKFKQKLYPRIMEQITRFPNIFR